MEDKAYSFDLTLQPRSIIKVVGVGGGGSNAVNFMYNQGFRDVEFVICNTDSQALKTSPVPSKIQLGNSLLGGLGAGSIPENGKEAALLSEDAIREMLNDGTKMVFITAGMGGGTGTGAAPVIARVAKELSILTIGIVTKPFRFEGPRKNQAADRGIAEMRQYCDTVIEILNDKIRELFGNMPMNQAFAQADHVLSTSAKSLSEIITVPGIINVDFKDIETTMKDSGTAVMGSAIARGDNRAMKVVQEAISSPLLNNNEIEGATKVLLAITYGHAPELTMDEFYQITEFIEARTGSRAEVIFGTTMDPEMGDSIQVTVIATGFESDHFLDAKDAVVTLSNPTGVNDKEFDIKHSIQNPQPTAQGGYQPTNQQPFTQQPYSQPPTYQQPQPIPAPVRQEPIPTNEVRQPESQPEQVNPTQPSDSPQYVDINGNFQVMYQSPPDVDRPLEEVDSIVGNRQDFGRQISRSEILRNLSATAGPKPNYDDPEYLRNAEHPAYKRRNPNFVPAADNMSRTTMNESGEMLKNNRYLHDNVD